MCVVIPFVVGASSTLSIYLRAPAGVGNTEGRPTLLVFCFSVCFLLLRAMIRVTFFFFLGLTFLADAPDSARCLLSATGRVLGNVAPVNGGVRAQVAGQPGADASGVLFGDDGERMWECCLLCTRAEKRAAAVAAAVAIFCWYCYCRRRRRCCGNSIGPLSKN